jgi:hypothetical protein
VTARRKLTGLAAGVRKIEQQQELVAPLHPCRCGHKRHLHYRVRRGDQLQCSRCACSRFEAAP